VLAQQGYYRRMADRYDELHTSSEDEHYVALRHVAAYLQWIGARTVLDTGCGTGRAMRFLHEALPEVHVHGNDPSAELLEIASERHGLPAESLTCAPSDPLPFADASFDAVIATGMLHHVPQPDVVVAEMLRVARLAVFISDDNIYGAGPLANRLAKLGLRRVGLLGVVNTLRRRGRAWYYNDTDGIAWSYSVFDSYNTLRDVCAAVVVLPTSPGPAPRLPILQSAHCLLCGFRQPLPDRPPAYVAPRPEPVKTAPIRRRAHDDPQDDPRDVSSR
jgi:SAM-dependent methyltransferase